MACIFSGTANILKMVSMAILFAKHWLLALHFYFHGIVETMVLQDNYAHLQHTIQAPEDVANRLFSRGKIDSHTKGQSSTQQTYS